MILVIGATGSVGRLVVDRLLAAGERVRACSRTPETARLPPGVDVVRADLGRLETLPRLFDGVEKMYCISVAGDRVIDPPEGVIGHARRAGVRRVALLSASGRPYLTVEGAVRQSGMEWTFVRPGEFATTKLDMWAASIRSEGLVRSAYLDIPTVPIHEADIADVVATALLEDGHAGAIYELTGPVQITQREQIRAIGTALGRDLRIIELDHAQARATLISEGWPEDIVDHDLAYFVEWESAPPQAVPTVQNVTGRPGRTFPQWAADHVADFR